MNLKDTFGKECWKRAKYYQDQNEKLQAKVKELEKKVKLAEGMSEVDQQIATDAREAREYYEEEITKLKAERDRYKELGAVLENKSSNLEVEVEQLHDALKIADEALIWLDDYITQNYGGMKYMQERITEFRQKIKETLSDISGKGEKSPPTGYGFDPRSKLLGNK